MKNLLIFLVMVNPLIEVVTVGDTMPLMDPLTESFDGMSRADSVSRAEHPHQAQNSGCCHIKCMCCTAHGFVTLDFQVDRSVSTGIALTFSPANFSNPHLESLLRPPRLA